MNKLTLNAPSKINIGLNILNKRDDGFHNLITFFYPIYDLCDTLIFEKSNHFIFDSNNIDLIKDHSNLIQRAHTSIENYCKKKINVKVFLDKKIPIGAGLGGGSSDAASTLLGLNEMFMLNIKEEKLLDLALELGSDVPFFIKSKPSIGSSRGEILQLSNNYIEKPIVIINPGIHISTKEAFTNITPKATSFNYNSFITNENINYSLLNNNLSNDFEKYVFSTYPEIKLIKTKLYENGALFSLMSGTGSTVYGIFDDLEKAKYAFDLFPSNYFKFISHVE